MLKRRFAPKQLQAQDIEKNYVRWMYYNMIITLACFTFAVERTFLILPLFVIVTLGYVFRRTIDSKWLEAVASIGLVAIFAFIYLMTHGDTLFSAGGILIGTYVLFFFRQEKHRRSPVNLLTILGMMLLCTSLLNRFAYLFFFILFIISSTRLLHYSLLYRQQNSHAVQAIHHEKVSYQGMFKKLMAYSGVCIIGFTIALVVFILIPRSHKWEFATSGRLNIGKTGFSNKMTSASVHSILSDPNIFFAVQTKNTSDYFKGAVYDKYDGSQWRVTLPHRKLPFNGYLELREPTGKASREVYKFNNSPGRTIFYRNNPVVIQSRGARFGIEIDSAGNINSNKDFRKKFIYMLWSDLKEQASPDREWVDKYYLQLPENISQRVKDKAQEIMQGKENAKQKAQAVSGYLKQNFYYTLGMSPGKNEVSDYFLFEAKRGYCIHFATVMVVMLRSQGIPARVVGGFRSGKYEKGHVIVSNEDAHAWVEVFDGIRWQFFDPTPPQEDYLTGLSYWKRLYYKLYSFWTLEVLGFSYTQQKTIYGWIKQFFQWAKTKIWFIAAFFVLIYLRKFTKHKQQKIAKKKKAHSGKKQKSSISIANTFYQKMLSILSQAQIFKYSEETPLEFLARSKEVFPDGYNNMEKITNAFCEIHFGHRDYTQEKQTQVENNILQLQNVVENHIELAENSN